MSEKITFRKDHNVVEHSGGGGCDLMSLVSKRLVVARTESCERFDKDKIKLLIGSDQITSRNVDLSS